MSRKRIPVKDTLRAATSEDIARELARRAGEAAEAAAIAWSEASRTGAEVHTVTVANRIASNAEIVASKLGAAVVQLVAAKHPIAVEAYASITAAKTYATDVDQLLRGIAARKGAA